MSAIRIGRVAFYVGMQARGSNGVNPPWHGFTYGRWLPRFGCGRYPGCRYLDACWLCFHATVYVDGVAP